MTFLAGAVEPLPAGAGRGPPCSVNRGGSARAGAGGGPAGAGAGGRAAGAAVSGGCDLRHGRKGIVEARAAAASEMPPPRRRSAGGGGGVGAAGRTGAGAAGRACTGAAAGGGDGAAAGGAGAGPLSFGRQPLRWALAAGSAATGSASGGQRIGTRCRACRRLAEGGGADLGRARAGRGRRLQRRTQVALGQVGRSGRSWWLERLRRGSGRRYALVDRGGLAAPVRRADGSRHSRRRRYRQCRGGPVGFGGASRASDRGCQGGGAGHRVLVPRWRCMAGRSPDRR